MSTVPFYVIDTLIAACGMKPTDNVQKIEITAQGIIVTCAYTVETDEGWRTFTIETGDGEEAVLTYQKFIDIERPVEGPAEHTHEDGETHSHGTEELVETDA